MELPVAIIGFGEAASTFARGGDWRERACAFDIDPSRTSAMRDLGIRAASTAGEAVRSASLVISLVTADQALAAARQSAASLAPGALWCDMNSVAPDTKCAAAEAVQAGGARYIDVAVLAPVSGTGLHVPLLLAGPDAASAEAALRALGFDNISRCGAEIGRASAVKMIRSVMIKGVEALTDEMMQAAQQAGVAAEVLASLDATERPFPWTVRAAYNCERMEKHGLRRAAEMEESAKTLQSLGVEPTMTRGTIQRQRDAARRKAAQ
ncbi:NAD(P)-dependent oxidoreductase [Novosphingobium sp.]|uniref:NAD(P)-dependent oxidoreductase n=1 Tax=Novosphingobium sp. TaxID=1874826 RepID=UPI0025F0C8A4|nr:NAD(P)-dependent oxidoreductase [Novosphingobium sp.]